MSWIVLLFLALLGDAIGDIPRCDKEDPDFTLSPYCLPLDYNKDIVPPTDGPLLINVDIWVFEVSKIDDIALAMTFELYFDLTWSETRLVINDTSEQWSPSGVMGSTNFVKSMWLPDIQILHLKQFQTRNIVTDVAGLIIFQDKRVLYTVSTEAIISCPMKFSAYPLDHQECRFLVGSYIHDASQIFFSGTHGHDVEKQRAQQYEIKITDLDEADKNIFWVQRNYSLTGFKINMVRRRTPVLLQVYLPSGLFVIVSWISFIVPPEVVPGRMALLVTLFLVLVNIFNSVTANAPKSEGLTAVETWVVMCIIHVFCVLAEYAIILKIMQVDKHKTEKARKAMAKNILKQQQNQLLQQQSSVGGGGGGGGGTGGSRMLHLTQHQQRLMMMSGSSSPLEQIFDTELGAATVGTPTATATTNAAATATTPSTNHDQHHHPPVDNHCCGGGGGGVRHRSSAPTSMGQMQMQQSSDDYPDMSETTAVWHKMDSSYARCTSSGNLQSASSLHHHQQHQQSQQQQSQQPSISRGFYNRLMVESRIGKIDRVAMWLFPLFFFLFNVAYWCYYLVLNEMRSVWG